MAAPMDNEPMEAYLRQAESWNEEAYRKIKASRTRAWILSAIMSVIAIVAVFAVAALAPLKRVETVPVVVNQETGHVEVKKPLSVQAIDPSMAVKKADLGEYVINRETFDSAGMEKRYNAVAITTSPQAFQRYARLFDLPGERNPLNRYSGAKKRVVKINSITLLNDHTGQVRFTTTIQKPQPGNSDVTQHWIATIQFDYTSRPMTLEKRIKNPLGFIVQSYRVDQARFQQG